MMPKRKKLRGLDGPATARLLADIEAALRVVAEANGVEIVHGPPKHHSENTMTMWLDVSITENGIALDRYAEDLIKFGEQHGLSNAFGRTVRLGDNKRTCIVVGYDSSVSKFPVIVLDVETKKKLRFALPVIKAALGRESVN
jgi:hypothetical protein